MTLSEPGGVCGADRAFFDPAVAAVCLLMTRTLGRQHGIGEEQRGVRLERPLIAFER